MGIFQLLSLKTASLYLLFFTVNFLEIYCHALHELKNDGEYE